MMNVVRVCCLVTGVLAISVPALSQEQQREPFSRSYVSALAGASFATETKTTLAVEYGERVDDIVQAYANFTYFDDLMSDEMRGALAFASGELVRVTGLPWEFGGRDRGLALTAGGKVVVPATGAVRPYVGAGFGALHLRRTITEQVRGDVTEPFVQQFGEFGFSDGVIGSTRQTATKPLGEVIAGVNFLAGRTYVDLSYRYRHAFRAPKSLSFSQLAAGVGLRF